MTLRYFSIYEADYRNLWMTEMAIEARLPAINNLILS